MKTLYLPFEDLQSEKANIDKYLNLLQVFFPALKYYSFWIIAQLKIYIFLIKVLLHTSCQL